MTIEVNSFGILRRGGVHAAFLALVALSVLPAAAQNAWLIGDFDGDQKPDLVALGGPQRSAPSIRAGLFDDGALVLARRFTDQWLVARDLDGDSDRDIIVGSRSSAALAVWINDGTGHFVPGRLEDFQLQHNDEDSRTLDSCPKSSLPDLTDENPRGDALSPPAPCRLRIIRQYCARAPELLAFKSYYSAQRTRGPPLHS